MVSWSIKGADAAFEELYRRYQRMVYGLCLRYTDGTEPAQDMMQECFFRAWKKLKSYRGHGSFGGWLKTLSIRYLLNQNRPDFSEEVKEQHAFAMPATYQDTMEIIRLLPTGYRTVFCLYAIDGYSHREIGKMLGIKEKTSQSQLVKARRMLQKMLKYEP